MLSSIVSAAIGTASNIVLAGQVDQNENLAREIGE
jgi:hypothetical protein